MGKEESKRYRDKRKKENVQVYNEFKAKERERVRKYREPHPSHTPEIKNTVKQKQRNAERQRLHREREKYKIENTNAVDIPYKSKQSLFKAVNRVRKVLPGDDQRKKMVLEQLFSEYYTEASEIVAEKKKKRVARQKELKNTKLLHGSVKEFYEREDLTYQTPGKSDTISVKVDMNKLSMQKRYLTVTLHEAYALYCEESGDRKKVGKTTFFSLKPPNIMLVGDTPHNVCVCQSHANVDFLCTALKPLCGFPPNRVALLQQMCCDINNENCMIGECKECEKFVEDVLPLQFEYDVNIFWKKWEKNKDTSKLGLQKYKTSSADAINELQAQLPKFKKHFHVNRVQSQYFQNLRKSLENTEVVLQIDFAENFAIFKQDEIQAAHFSYNQVTIFTTCVWSASETYSSVFISEDLSHDKY